MRSPLNSSAQKLTPPIKPVISTGGALTEVPIGRSLPEWGGLRRSGETPVFSSLRHELPPKPLPSETPQLDFLCKAPQARHTSPQPGLGSHRNAHLSDHQIDDHLIGDLPSEAAAHLAACSLCSERVTAAAAPLASFQSLTLAWSERQSATLPRPNLSQHKPLWQRHATWIAACLALTFGSALANMYHHFDTQTPIQTAAQTAALEPPQALHTQLLAGQPASPNQAVPQNPDSEHAELQPVSLSPSPRRAHLHRAVSLPAPVETASLILPPGARQISADNRMLQAISDEFGIPSEIPSTLGIASVSEPVRQTSTLSLQD